MLSKNLKLSPGKKIYFASDFHLGAPTLADSRERERQILRWLDTIQADCETLVLLGDVFDFWFEYRHVVPKGAVRLLGKLAELTDQGVQVLFFTGNHDLWYQKYLTEEIGLTLFRQPTSFQIRNIKFYLAHGDGLDKKNLRSQFIRWMFSFSPFQWLFGWLHPTVGFGIATVWSNHSRKSENEHLHEQEVQIAHSKMIEAQVHHDYYVMGDSHYPNTVEISSHSTFINLGDWISNQSFASFDGQKLILEYFQPER